MDNNLNGQQIAGQPTYQQPQQAPQQPVYQAQPQQPAYAQATSPVYQAQQAPKKPSNINVLGLIAIICSGVGALFAILGTTLMCACSAAAVKIDGETSTSWAGDIYAKDLKITLSTHPILVLAIIGGVMAIAGVVLAIISLKQKDAKVKAGKMAWVAIVVGLFATVYAFLPTFMICGYNCALDGSIDTKLEVFYATETVEDLWD